LTNQKSQVYAHIIGTEQSDDVLVYEELDDTVFVDITSSKDGVSEAIFQTACAMINKNAIEICYYQCKHIVFL
jgi:protease II